MKQNRKPGDYNPHRAWRFIWSAFLILAGLALVGGYLAYQQLLKLEEFSQRRIMEEEIQTTYLNLENLKQIEAWLANKTEPIKPRPEPVPELETKENSGE